MTIQSTCPCGTLSELSARAVIAFVDVARAFTVYRFNNGALLGVTLLAVAKFAASGWSLGLGSPKLEQSVVSVATAVLYASGMQLLR